jgi:hypothetical protein
MIARDAGSTAEYSWWKILFSSDMGISWNSPDSGISVEYITDLITLGTETFAATLTDGLYRSTNCGKSWHSVNTGLRGNHVASLVRVDRNIFAATGRGVYVSTSEGVDWRQTDTGLAGVDLTSLAVSGHVLFAGTPERGVWRRPLSEMADAITEPKAPQFNGYTLLQNYPNPFNPTTVITYSLPVKALVTLTVCDILGRVVKTLVNDHQNEGTYSVTFSACDLSSGVYFYRLSAGHFRDTKKLLLIK